MITDFGSGCTVDKKAAHLAAKTVTRNAEDTKDALFLLDMLGLIPPQPGYESITQNQYREKQRNSKRREEVRMRKRKEREAIEIAKLIEQGISPEEIGEVYDEDE